MNISIKSIIFFFLIFLLQAILQGFIDFNPLIQFCLLLMVIVALPQNWRLPVVMAVAFGIGLAADFMSQGIPGINAGSAVLVAALRDVVYRRLISTDNRSATTAPSILSLGKLQYFKYIAILSAAYCLLYIFFDRFSLAPLGENMLRFLTTFSISTVVMFIFSHFAPQD